VTVPYPLRRSVELVRERGLRGLAATAARHSRLAAASLVAPAVFRRRAREVRTLGDAIDLAVGFDFAGITISPIQRRAEVEAFLALVAEARPQVVVEIGTALGGTLYMLAHVADDSACVISIDMRGGAFGGGYPAIRKPLYHAFAHGLQRIELIRADSHDPGTLDRVRRLLAGRPVDVLFIDGDHSYDGVRRDFDLYGRLVRPGGIVAFHDIVQGGEGVGVPQYWEELESRYETQRLLSEESQRNRGIGVLRIPAR
jgi:predicted O-methyltransferase YrrM